MCAERIQRILMAIMLGFVLLLWGQGMNQYAFILQVFIIVMILVWAVTNFCPSLWFFKKIFGSCNFDKEK